MVEACGEEVLVKIFLLSVQIKCHDDRFGLEKFGYLNRKSK